jgi:uncharacterized protein (UPF0332 family)
VIRNSLELWIEPEINRRLVEGRIDASWRMFSAQVVMNVGMPIQVRLNGEVAAVFAGRLKDPRAAEIGKVISLDEFETVDDVRLTTADDNAAHITLLVRGDHWFVSFDFRYNREMICEYLRVADEFIATARDAFVQDRLRAFVENLLAAVEHMARCYLLQRPDEQVRRPETEHNFVQTEFNRQGKHGNVDREFVLLLNRLWNLRKPARYLPSELQLMKTDAEELLAAAAKMRKDIEERLPPRVAPPQSG